MTGNHRLADSNPGLCKSNRENGFSARIRDQGESRQTGGIRYLQIPRCREIKLLKCLVRRGCRAGILIKCDFAGLQKFSNRDPAAAGDFKTSAFHCRE